MQQTVGQEVARRYHTNENVNMEALDAFSTTNIVTQMRVYDDYEHAPCMVRMSCNVGVALIRRLLTKCPRECSRREIDKGLQMISCKCPQVYTC